MASTPFPSSEATPSGRPPNHNSTNTSPSKWETAVLKSSSRSEPKAILKAGSLATSSSSKTTKMLPSFAGTAATRSKATATAGHQARSTCHIPSLRLSCVCTQSPGTIRSTCRWSSTSSPTNDHFLYFIIPRIFTPSASLFLPSS